MSSFPEDQDQWQTGLWSGADEGPHDDSGDGGHVRRFHRKFSPLPEPQVTGTPQQSQTSFVCPDGSAVADPSQCQGAATQAAGQNPTTGPLPTIAGLDLNNPLVMIGLLVAAYFLFFKK